MQCCGYFTTTPQCQQELLLLVPTTRTVGKLETYCASVQQLISVNAEYLKHKGACYDSQTDPWMCPCIQDNQIIKKLILNVVIEASVM